METPCSAPSLLLQISPEQGAFMGWLVGTLGAKRIIEVRPASPDARAQRPWMRPPCARGRTRPAPPRPPSVASLFVPRLRGLRRCALRSPRRLV